MNPDEFDFFLDQLISVRHLTIGDDERGHWWETLSGVEAPVFREAVRRMISEDEAYPSPAHVRQVCATIMRERLSREVQPPPPSGLSQEEYSAWNREWRKQVVCGATAAEANRHALVAQSRVHQLPGPDTARSPGQSPQVIEGSVIQPKRP